MNRLVAFLCILLLTGAQAAFAVTHHVGKDGFARGYELNETVYGAADGDTVLVYPGVYRGTYIYTASKDLVIRSVEGPEKTILDGEKGHMIAWFLHATDKAVIEGFTFRNGRDMRFSGAIRCGGDVIIRNNIFEGCQAGFGGAIYVPPRRFPTIENNLFRNNIATTMGGAIYAQVCGPKIRNNTFVENHAEDGGDDLALYNTSARVTNNLFVANKGFSSIYIKGALSEAEAGCNAFWKTEGEWIDGDPGSVFPEDENRKTADPLFADTELYRLSEGSPYGKGCDCGPIGWER